MRRGLLHICMIWAIFAFGNKGCDAEPVQRNSNEEESHYAQVVRAVGAKRVLRTEDWLRDPRLVDLASHGADNIDNCVAVLSSDRFTWRQRSVAILSMYQLKRDDYVRFLKEISRINSSLSERELFSAIGNYYLQPHFIEYYKYEKVRDVLKYMEGQPTVSYKTKAHIEAILSGKVIQGFERDRRIEELQQFINRISSFVKWWQLLLICIVSATIYSIARMRKASRK